MRINTLTFSPTGTSRKIAQAISAGISLPEGIITDVTHVEACDVLFAEDELLLVSVPVYGGHVAPLALKRMERIKGNGTPAIAVVVYGNRHYEKALTELFDFLNSHGFNVIGAGTFIGEHSYSTPQTPIAPGRPNSEDLAFAKNFGSRIRAKVLNATHPTSVDVTNIEQPQQDADVMLRFKQTVAGWMNEGKSMPKCPTTDMALCTECGICAKLCPTGAISPSSPSSTDANKCIKCCACIKGCYQGARQMNTPFAQLITANFSVQKENKILL